METKRFEEFSEKAYLSQPSRSRGLITNARLSRNKSMPTRNGVCCHNRAQVVRHIPCVQRRCTLQKPPPGVRERSRKQKNEQGRLRAAATITVEVSIQLLNPTNLTLFQTLARQKPPKLHHSFS